MNRRSIIFAFTVILSFRVSSSIACLNDTEVSRGEDEFRSRYETNSPNVLPVPPNLNDSAAINPWAVGGLSIGGTLIVASSFVALRRQLR